MFKMRYSVALHCLSNEVIALLLLWNSRSFARTLAFTIVQNSIDSGHHFQDIIHYTDVEQKFDANCLYITSPYFLYSVIFETKDMKFV